jgi:hypothetical protein
MPYRFAAGVGTKPTGQGAIAGHVVLDGSNNAYIAGEADTTGSEENMFFARYAASGVRKWAKTWHDTGKDDDSVGGARAERFEDVARRR